MRRAPPGTATCSSHSSPQLHMAAVCWSSVAQSHSMWLPVLLPPAGVSGPSSPALPGSQAGRLEAASGQPGTSSASQRLLIPCAPWLGAGGAGVGSGRAGVGGLLNNQSHTSWRPRLAEGLWRGPTGWMPYFACPRLECSLETNLLQFYVSLSHIAYLNITPPTLSTMELVKGPKVLQLRPCHFPAGFQL